MSQSPNPAATQQVAHLLASATNLLKAGRPADAIAPLRDAALAEPSNAIIHHDLGLACLEVGRVSDAIAALRRAVASQPALQRCLFSPGNCLGEVGRSSAGQSLRTTAPLSCCPSLAEAWFRAGALVYELGHRDEALGCFRRAAATGGKTGFGRLGKARALLIEDRNQEAEQVLRKMLARDPKTPWRMICWVICSPSSAVLMRLASASRTRIANAPLLAGMLLRSGPVSPHHGDDDGLLQRMEAALATPGLEAAQRLRLHLAIGKAADDLGDYALAMQHFDAADAVRRTSTPFDSAAFSLEIDRLIARCTSRIDRAGARTRQQRCDAGADHRHAAIRHNSRRADRLHAS